MNHKGTKGHKGAQREIVKVVCVYLTCALCISWTAPAKSNPHFNVRLVLNYASAEQTVELYEGRSGRAADIARKPGSQVAVGTTGILAQRRLDVALLEQHLESAKHGHTEPDDVFRLKEARERVADIKELLTEIKRRNFAQRVISTIEQLFPADAEVSATLPLYFVAFGHHNIDAYVMRVVWDGDAPRFVGEGQGEPVIVVNLAKAVYYGRNIEERFIGTLAVVAHEVFHAAFTSYKDQSPVWKEYYATHRRYIDQLLDLTHNEGIAHYLTFGQRSRGYLPPDWNRKVSTAFDEFNKNAEELLSASISPRRASELIRTSNTAEYWDSYGAITGMFIARTIDLTLGRAALAATIANGPHAFFRTYADLVQSKGNLPALSNNVLRAVKP